MKAFSALGQLLFGAHRRSTENGPVVYPRLDGEESRLPPRLEASVLPGFGGRPHFPRGIERLQRHYDLLGTGTELAIGVDWFHNAARQVEGFPFAGQDDEVETTSGLRWPYGYRFALPGGGEALILFPLKDREGRSGWHCAIYVRDGTAVGRHVLEQLVAGFIAAIEN